MLVFEVQAYFSVFYYLDGISVNQFIGRVENNEFVFSPANNMIYLIGYAL